MGGAACVEWMLWMRARTWLRRMASSWRAPTSRAAGTAAFKGSTGPVMDYYLVLDFEATCEKNSRIKPQEIIEFPVLKVNARTHVTESEFHSYVQPTVHTQLTAFCTQLTGVTQDMVDGQPVLKDVMVTFHDWMNANGLLDPHVKACFVTCGDWDLKTMLPGQCQYFHIPIPNYFRQWINIKHVFRAITGKKVSGMTEMLDHLGLTLDGRHHSGIDDSRNIAKILVALARQNPALSPTMTLPPFEFKV